ncbi:neugrin [Phlebotomus argentipes]|uniref:neugrin n=1 Tax=Phlebotomus argentipes TaxID=94469 RepID=UPI002892C43F|nr:neugrin [Phlebotomus argentipes]
MFKSVFLRIHRSPVVSQYRYLPRKTRWQNPGVDGRIEMLREERDTEIRPEDVEEDLESDFMNAGQMYGKYKAEERWQREKLAHWITGDKYFKRKQLNFLTWSEKEQIRFLHRESPSEWSAEKLADSFPADIMTIRKIIKSAWLPADEKRILRHDEHVQRNWKAFQEGKLKDMSDDLKEHLQKFAHRKFDTSATPKVHLQSTSESALKLPVGEFTRILTSCKAYAQIEGKREEKPKVKALEDGEKQEEKMPFRGGKEITLDKLKRLEGDSNALSQPEPENSPEVPAIPMSGDKMEIFNVKKYNSAPAINHTSTLRAKQPDIRQRIYIPKHLWKRGGTYKLGDCFYDDDGEFLYRVPGMTGQ